MRDPNACDITTGECLICLNNTAGVGCAQCRDWWFGDAVNAKDCSRKSVTILNKHEQGCKFYMCCVYHSINFENLKNLIEIDYLRSPPRHRKATFLWG